jgi:hypothetical protein
MDSPRAKEASGHPASRHTGEITEPSPVGDKLYWAAPWGGSVPTHPVERLGTDRSVTSDHAAENPTELP